MHQALQGATFHLEHIVPKSADGSDDPINLAWACPGCNLKKADRVTLPSPETDAFVPLFNPRTDRWSDHLAWDGYAVVGLSIVGHALIAAFDLNHPRRLLIRQAEEHFGLFPPPSEK
jgi:HNH endonuclease